MEVISQKLHSLYSELVTKQNDLNAIERKQSEAQNKLLLEKKALDNREAELNGRQSQLMAGESLEKEIKNNKVTIEAIRKEGDEIQLKRNALNKERAEMAKWIADEKSKIQQEWDAIKQKQVDQIANEKKHVYEKQNMKKLLLEEMAK